MSHFDRVYLSPHLDDAVFSCGGRIHGEVRRGLSVLIATVATAPAPARLSRYATRFQRRGRLGPEPIRTRRDEDRQAARLLGVEVLHLGLPDAMYRIDTGRGRPLYPTLLALLGKPRTGDPLPPLLSRCLAELPGSELLLLPCAIGGHVDHRLTREVAQVAYVGRGLAFWEDFPYLTRLYRPGPRPKPGWQSETVPLDAEALEARCQAMAAYPSQVRALFGSERKMRRRVERTVRRLGGERFWRHP